MLIFPVPLRYWLNCNRKLYAKVHRVVVKEIHSYYVSKAKLTGIKEPTTGSISFTQRWGWALNLNPHMHILCPDGVYVRQIAVNGRASFRQLDAILQLSIEG